MVRYEIEGGRPLCGECRIQGSKNAVLPMMAAALLNRGCTVLHNCPKIEDVYCMIRILERMGCVICWQGHTLIIDAHEVMAAEVSPEDSRKMRSSVMLLGAMLGRCKRAVLGEPGGCVIGERPIDLHLFALKKMGATILRDGEMLYVEAPKLRGTYISLDKPSVGATENIILAAVLAEGTTRIFRAAREPEIVELCRFLSAMGADIRGAGSSGICIRGVKRLHDAQITVVPDRIVAGTYMLAAAGTGGGITILNPPGRQLHTLVEVMRHLRIPVMEKEDVLQVMPCSRYRGIPFLETGPYPGFPTDLQSPLLSVLLKAGGKSMIKENIFESRFRVVEEFRKMGAHISCDGQFCVVLGVPELKGADVYAHELRGGAALIIAGLMAEGKTVVHDSGYIARGYEDIDSNLHGLGAKISSFQETNNR